MCHFSLMNHMLAEYASLGKQVATWGESPVKLQGYEHIGLEPVIWTHSYLHVKMQWP